MMDSKWIRALLANKDETPTLEFKLEYVFAGQGKTGAQDEFGKDIVALTNTAGRAVDDDAYLIIGASDKLNADGERDLTDVRRFKYRRKTFLDIVNARCQPQIPKLIYEEVELDGTWLGVILVPPSPYVHQLSRDLLTPTLWRKNTVLIRHGDETAVASVDEITLMKQQKEELFAIRGQDDDLKKYIDVCAYLERNNADAFEAHRGSDLRLWAERMADQRRLVRSSGDLFTLAHHLNPEWR